MDARIALNFLYVNDCGTTGYSLDTAWKCSWRVASYFNHLGLQDAPQKRHQPSTEPGAWAGSIIHSSKGVVMLNISIEQWNKAQGMLQWINDCVKACRPMDHKVLEQYHGFLVCVSCTYPSIVPYLKGIHLTLDSWHDNHDTYGWKLPMSELKAAMALKGHVLNLEPLSVTPPWTVTTVPQLIFDIEALMRLFSSDKPPKQLVRPSASVLQSPLWLHRCLQLWFWEYIVNIWQASLSSWAVVYWCHWWIFWFPGIEHISCCYYWSNLIWAFTWMGVLFFFSDANRLVLLKQHFTLLSSPTYIMY